MKCTIMIPKGMQLKKIHLGQYTLDKLTSKQWTSFTEVTMEGSDAERLRNEIAREIVEWEKTHPRRTTI